MSGGNSVRYDYDILNDLAGGKRKLAVWQFQCYIISLTKKSDKLSRDEMISWKNIENPLISPDFLERQKSWSTDIVQYGNIDRTCIEFIYLNWRLWYRS